ncbi:response regulator [Pleionea sp. CnH1-48]|uniref:response regulator n=1 Tax=Pleionea sp. CnH1-48 TaxID=2954494 RepID=UPI002097B7BF|nr:response regulator [Pleionea sp. CnH1-48]MCO7224163.1 response regulator [Pleionea sp. CnH1-48]
MLAQLFKSNSLGRRLIVYFLICSWLPLIISSYYNFSSASVALEQVERKRLDTYLNTYTRDIQKRMDDLGKIVGAKIESPDLIQQVSALNAKRADFDSLRAFTQSFAWAELDDQYGNHLRQFAFHFAFYDVMLIGTEGDILFTIRQNDELGKNIFNMPASGKNISLAFQRALSSDRLEFSDIVHYEPAKKKPLAFFVRGILDDYGKKQGTIAISIPAGDVFRSRLQQEDLVTYIVGEDLVLRSYQGIEGHQTFDYDPNNPSPIIQQWLRDGETALFEGSYLGYQNKDVIGELKPLDVLGVKVGVIAEVEEAKALARIEPIKTTSLSVLTIASLLVLVLAILLSLRIVRPIRIMTEWGDELSQGKLENKEVRSSYLEIRQLYNAFTNILFSFREVTNTCENIAKGNTNVKVVARGTDDALLSSLMSMRDTLKVVVERANLISEGNYEVHIQPNSNDDHLSKAINNMSDNLRHLEAENSRKQWLEESRANLLETMGGDNALEDLCSEITAYLVKQSDASIGVMYVAEDEDYRLVGSYAYSFRKDPRMVIRKGEGYIGQAILEKKYFVLQDLPEDYCFLSSGVGYTPITSSLILPLAYNDNVVGVLELGFRNEIDSRTLSFLKSVAESIAVALDSSITRYQLTRTISKVQQQAQDLEEQKHQLSLTNEKMSEQTVKLQESELKLKRKHEELESNNIKLQEQTEQLRSSEEALQVQKEELRATNEQLEEKARALTDKTVLIEKQNNELEKAKDSLTLRTKELEKSSRYKSEFLANMSHELRTPLNSILLLSETLATNRSKNLSGSDIESLKIINRSGSDLLHIINDILDLSKVEAGKLEVVIEPIELEELLNELHSTFQADAEKKSLAFNFEIKNGCPTSINSDRQRIKQVMKNLLSNAIKFTSEGSIDVTCRPDERELYGEGITIDVADSGIGIAKEKIALIFKAFKQADGSISRQFGGTGLGLSICKNLLELLNGDITVESTPGEGSRFSIFIPESIDASSVIFTPVNEPTEVLITSKPEREIAQEKHDISDSNIEIAPEPKSEPNPESEVESPTPINGHCICRFLVVEDDERTTKAMRKAIGHLPADFEYVNTGKEGLRRLVTQHYDGLVLDLGLPDLLGVDLLTKLEKLKSSLPEHILIYSAQEMDKDTYQRLRSFSNTLIVKGKDASQRLIEELSTCITSICDSKKDSGSEQKIPGISLLSGKKVLLVDDDLRNSFALSKELKEQGLIVDIAENGRTAVEKVEAMKDFDIVLMDIMMPVMDGYEATMNIRQKLKFEELPIIALTANALPDDRQRCIDSGASDYLSKPVNIKQLLSVMQVWLNHD